MDFEFLPNLPKSNLDDRTLSDLLTECRLRIPRYCPEWTNFNPSDPGMTLIELFGWMTEQMLERFNQVPRRNYIAFLELLGVRLHPPVPAQADLTFYLNTTLPDPYTIPEGVEVATMRTETEDAIVFSTDRALLIGKPRLGYFLTADRATDRPQQLRDRFADRWSEDNGQWAGPEQTLFDEQPLADNCFYLVLEPDVAIAGNVVAITIKGAAATSTGINPQTPPRRWEAWDGYSWQSVLRQEADDGTQGFSFSDVSHPLDGADIVLHLPQQLPIAAFDNYQGHWLRCVCLPHDPPMQPGYLRSPRIVGLSVRSVGGTVSAHQSTVITEEILGLSDGTANQSFQLLNPPVLPRRRDKDEYLEVITPQGEYQSWQEVTDFADSLPEDRHYLIDSMTGTVQFGPLVREPFQLHQSIEERNQIQQLGQRASQTALIASGERQYGAIPPRGAVVRMRAYRTGGGSKGNVQAHTVRILKTAIPYVADVENHHPARNGADAESLEQAVMRVPRLLRSRDRAVTLEDFETLTLQGSEGAIARALCLPAEAAHEAGTVRLRLVPQTNLDTIQQGRGIHPDSLLLTPALRDRILGYLGDRKLLGVRVELLEPSYTGVSVQAEVGIAPTYRHPTAQKELIAALQVALYRFLNPLTGGIDGSGWAFGRPVYLSDIIALLQQTPGVQYLGPVQLFELRRRGDQWERQPPSPIIDPGPLGLICSWQDALNPLQRNSDLTTFRRLRSSHTISVSS